MQEIGRVYAVYKAFQGHEFVTASIESVYGFADEIIMVHSDIGWDGSRGNTVRPVVEEWQKDNDDDHKVRHIQCNTQDQAQQCQAAAEVLKRKGEADVIMLVDTDEVWARADLERAYYWLTRKPWSRAYSSRMHTYLKTPFFRVAPPWGEPTVFVRDGQAMTEGARGEAVADKQLMDDVYFHHFTAVRHTDSDVRRKIKTSHMGDKEALDTPDVDKWMNSVWRNLPRGQDLHYFPGREKCWRGVEPVWVHQLPEAMQNEGTLAPWYPTAHVNWEEDARIWELSDQALTAVCLGSGQAQDFILGIRGVETTTIDQFPMASTVKQMLSLYPSVSLRTQALHDVPKRMEDDSVDMLVIDACLDFDNVMSYILSWKDIMSDGGLIVIKGNNRYALGVRAAVKEIEKIDSLIRLPEEEAGSLAVFGVYRV